MGLFSDIVDLAKAGWKPSDVKAILEMDQKKEEAKEDDQELTPKVKKSEKKEKEEPEIDYKAKYEEAQKKLEKIQSDSTKEDVSKYDLSIDEVIKDIAGRL